jgi:hypothetical protein
VLALPMLRPVPVFAQQLGRASSRGPATADLFRSKSVAEPKLN